MTAKLKPGIACSSCKKSFHFICTIIKPEDYKLYSDEKDPKIFLCSPCLKEYRRQSLTLSNVDKNPTPTINQRKSIPNTASIAEGNNTATTEKPLADLVKELTKIVDSLRNELVETRKEIAALKASGPASATTEIPAYYTINGIPEKEGENIQEIASKVISLKSQGFEIDPTTFIKRLHSRSPTHHSILVTVQRGTTQHKALESARGSNIPGRDFGFDCDKVHINESHTAQSYRLYKKSRVLKSSKDFQFVWIRNSRVYARKSTDSERISIRSEIDLEKLLK